MEERRKYIRIKLPKPLKVRFRMVSHGGEGITLKKGRGVPKNVSGGGMFLELPAVKPNIAENLFSRKYRLVVELEIPGYAPKITIPCKPIWADRKKDEGHEIYGMGIEFEKIKEEDRERLMKYMLELLIQ